ncbi:hypothetical protein LJC23_00560 [Desulfovibrio sp. OttesenSCG-928-I05]|nr:hypothetical protein [Desulfovibrio sp. OttesenSCG-928-I05]
MSQFPTSTTRLQTLALLRDQIISSSLMDGQSVDEFILSTLLKSPDSATSGRQKSAAALTGKMRGDAGMLRQASRNMDEASSVASIAQKGVATIKDSLSRMQELAANVASGKMTADEAKTTYSDLAKSIQGTIASTAYNGIKLLDESSWEGDERLTYDQGAGSASLSIQAGNAPMSLTLRGINLGDFDPDVDLADATAAADTAARLSEQAGTMGTMESGYESMAARFATEGKSMTHQSAILENTAARAMEDPKAEIQNLLLDFLLKNSGRIVDSSS